MLENIRIVLVETTHPGNIGAVARAMKNMGLGRLCLVAPKLFPHVEATARAAGADDILAVAEVVNDFNEAVQGCSFVMGTSARLRALPIELLAPHDAAQKAKLETQSGDVAIVFGRESSGLNNIELQRCNVHIHIPTVSQFSSLNLAAAVQVVVYELYMTSFTAAKVTPMLEMLATADEMERFYEHLYQVLVEIEFLDPKRSKKMMQRLRRLFNRTRLEQKELNILRGVLSAIQQKRECGSE